MIKLLFTLFSLLLLVNIICGTPTVIVPGNPLPSTQYLDLSLFNPHDLILDPLGNVLFIETSGTLKIGKIGDSSIHSADGTDGVTTAFFNFHTDTLWIVRFDGASSKFCYIAQYTTNYINQLKLSVIPTCYTDIPRSIAQMTVTSDDSKIFYTDNLNIYEYDIPTTTETLRIVPSNVNLAIPFGEAVVLGLSLKPGTNELYWDVSSLTYKTNINTWVSTVFLGVYVRPGKNQMGT